MTRRNSIDFLLANPIAHRGLHNNKKGVPENSLPAFKAATKKGLPFECDLHILKDGQIVAFHDDNIRRMTGKSADIRDQTLVDLPKLKNSDCRIPTLQEILSLVNGEVPILIDFKNDHVGTRLEETALPILKQYRGKFAIQSADPRTLLFFKKHAPEIPRGQSISPHTRQESDNLRSYLSQKYPGNPFSNPDFISCNAKHIHHPSAHIKGIPTLAWTIRNKADLEKVEPYCDNIICENII